VLESSLRDEQRPPLGSSPPLLLQMIRNKLQVPSDTKVTVPLIIHQLSSLIHPLPKLPLQYVHERVGIQTLYWCRRRRPLLPLQLSNDRIDNHRSAQSIKYAMRPRKSNRGISDLFPLPIQSLLRREGGQVPARQRMVTCFPVLVLARCGRVNKQRRREGR
jgi:hypothetical protein